MQTRQVYQLYHRFHNVDNVKEKSLSLVRKGAFRLPPIKFPTFPTRTFIYYKYSIPLGKRLSFALHTKKWMLKSVRCLRIHGKVIIRTVKGFLVCGCNLFCIVSLTMYNPLCQCYPTTLSVSVTLQPSLSVLPTTLSVSVTLQPSLPVLPYNALSVSVTLQPSLSMLPYNAVSVSVTLQPSLCQCYPTTLSL